MHSRICRSSQVLALLHRCCAALSAAETRFLPPLCLLQALPPLCPPAAALASLMARPLCQPGTQKGRCTATPLPPSSTAPAWSTRWASASGTGRLRPAAAPSRLLAH